MGTVPEVHHLRHAAAKVNFAKSRSFLSTFRSDLKETFLPDDPFRHMKQIRSAGGGCAAAAWSVVQYFVPAMEWGPRYTLAMFRYDLLAGVTIASLAIPQGISYARLANLPPVVGLYSSFVPPMVYAIFGSSKNLAVGNVAAASLLLASIIGSEVSQQESPELYMYLFFTAAFFTGVFEAALGIFRLGILVDFLSRSTISGFMGGTAIIVIMQQLKGVLGLHHFTAKTDVVSVLHSIFSHRHEWRWESVVLGICLVGFLFLSKHLVIKVPRLFWVPALAPLVVVILGGLFAYLVNAEEHGIHIVGPLKKGLSPISISQLKFESKYLGLVLKAGVISGILALSEGIAVGRSLAMIKNEQIDGNKEMIAFGIMNIVGSWFSCYLTTGPFSKSAVNVEAGCKTAMSNAIMSICMMLVLWFLAPLFKYTPLVALSAIIIVAMVGLIEYREAHHLFKVDKFDFVICMAAFFGVIFFNMTTGLALSVGLSILRALLYVARPTTCKLGNLPGTDRFVDVEQYPDSVAIPNILVLMLGSPLYYANASYLRERILRWIEEESIAEKNGDDLQYLILDIGGVTSIDNTGISMLLEVNRILGRRQIKIALANPRLQVAEKLVFSKYIEKIGKEWVFLSVNDAIAASHFALQGSRIKEEVTGVEGVISILPA
ncbi:putative sulfate transporter 3.5 [Canna indica]|uniref:Sulfate transporter 3.5 n=1 Tax=Canna indica TaxID=4628 RepID=A0AAQ3K1M2_9LILI|nr:putative sulfate transporter 3.5 [Canna indica]